MTTERVQKMWGEANKMRREAASEAAARLAFAEESIARRRAAQQRARDLLDKIGVASSEKRMSSVRDASNLVPLGLLGEPDERGRTHGFTKVYMDFDSKLVERQVRGRFFTRTELAEEKSDVVNDFGVLYFAGMEDGSNLSYFAGNHWHIVEQLCISRALDVERSLDEIGSIVSVTASRQTEE